MAKPARADKQGTNARWIAALVLGVALVLTVAFLVLGVTGAKLDQDGLYRLLPWLPSPGGETRWREALVPGTDFGETKLLTYTYPVPEGEPVSESLLGETAAIIGKRLADWGWPDAPVDVSQEERVQVTLPAQADESAATLAGSVGAFAFADPDGVVFLSGEHITYAGYQDTGGEGVFALSFVLDEVGKDVFGQKTTELMGQTIKLMLDGRELRAPSISTPLTEGSASIPGFEEEEARNYAVLMRSGALPLALNLDGSQPAAPRFGNRSGENLMIAMVVAIVLILLYLIMKYRLGGVVAAWALVLELAFMFFFAALSGAAFSVSTLLAIFSSFALAVFVIQMIYSGMKSDIDRGRSVKRALNDSYAKAGHASLDILAAGLCLSVVLMIMDTGVIGIYMRLFAVGLLVNLVLVHVVLRVLILQVINFFSEKTSLYTKEPLRKEAV